MHTDMRIVHSKTMSVFICVLWTYLDPKNLHLLLRLSEDEMCCARLQHSCDISTHPTSAGICCPECVIGDITTPAQADSKTKKADSNDMTKGLAAGFGAFIGMIVVIFILWCCCCVGDDSSDSSCCKNKKQAGASVRRTVGSDKCKVAPSPPQSAAPRSRAC